ncbi:MAG: FUSC family protein [Actinobacteria bacterium]|nr:FUSC family protein [Actinomycetota bacterium]
MTDVAGRTTVLRHARFALTPEPAPVLLRAGIAVLVEVIVVFFAVRFALVAAGHPDEGLTHAVLPAVFGGIFGFLGSLGGSLRSGLLRGFGLSLVALPLTLVAIASRDVPWAAGASLAAMTVLAGALAWRGEPLATLGSLLLYLYFLPLVFGAGKGVPLRYLLIGFSVMIVLNLVLRAVASLVPHRQKPDRVKATDEKPAHVAADGRFALVPEPQLTRLHRTTIRSALGLGVGAVVMSMTGNHNAVWVLMTLIALIPPQLPLTIDRVLQRLAGTAVAMVVLTVIDSAVPPGPLRLLALAPGIVLTIAFVRRSYALSVLGVSTVAVLAYAQVSAPLGEALLWRGLDTIVGAVIAIVVTLVIPVGTRPQPVWSR